ncbi:unnamed protein product [Arabis nemorensis]|uniref:Uncharacterized protein n=1 Tax=Arabis nemorensis TaxID=586526 RepID=A0A565AV13_9BRAS|nr:unnamed protein product [Arabis nemorensis]
MMQDLSSNAWKPCDPEAEKVFKSIKEESVKFAIVSNFDTRLRPLLRALRSEKPNSIIFLEACKFLGVNLEDAVRVEDDHGEQDMQVVTLVSEEVKLLLIWYKRHHVLKFF